MAKQTVAVHVCMSLNFPVRADGMRDYTSPQEWAPEVWFFKPDDNEERVYIGRQAVTIEVPDNWNPIPGQVAALEREKADALKKYQASVLQINERLSKLLAITNG